MSDELRAVFERLSRQEPPASRPLVAVRESGRRLRRRHRITAAAAAVGAVAVVVGVVAQSRASSTVGVVPARPTTASATPTTASATRTASLPAPNDPGVMPGFLQPDDLGRAQGWRRDTGDLGQESAPADRRVVAPFACLGQPVAEATARTRRTQAYLGRLPDGSGAWQLAEEEAVLDPAAATALRSGVDALRTCVLDPDVTNGADRGVVLADGEGLVVIGVLLPSGQIGNAYAVLVDGTHWISLSTSPGWDYLAPRPLPGQAGWIVETLRTAAQRLTGSPPAPPAMHAAATHSPSGRSTRPGPSASRSANPGRPATPGAGR